MLDFLSYFSADYAAARAKFLEAAAGAGARLSSHRNPAAGPGGLELSTEVAVLGEPGARTTLWVNSGTHGGEGFFGSAVQVAWLRRRGMRPLPSGLQVIMSHAINPYGFAWLRRTNEDNIDLNRNFVEHANAYPENPGYHELHEAILPKAWTPETQAAFREAYQAYSKEHGEMAVQAAITAGQYDYADGLFYGGRGESWSKRLIQEIARTHAAASERTVFVDLHTGLGSWAHFEIIHQQEPDGEGEAWLQRWLGTHSLGSLARADSVSVASAGALIENGVRRGLGGKPLIACTLEVGTRPVAAVLEALRADNWLHVHGDLESEQGRAIKAQLTDAFCPAETDWKEMVSLRGRQILDACLEGSIES